MLTNKFKLLIIIVEILLLIITIILTLIFNQDILVSLVLWCINGLIIAYIIYKDNYGFNKEFVNDTLQNSIKNILAQTKMGMLVYDDDYKIVWLSSFFDQYNILDKSNKVLTNWIPECLELINGEIESITINDHDNYFQLIKVENKNAIIFKDINDYTKLNKLYNDQSLVIGLIHFDNYDDLLLYEDESSLDDIVTHIRKPVIDYFIEKGILIKQLRSSKYSIITNEKTFQTLIDDQFSILKQTKDNSIKYNYAITLSMCFVKGQETIKDMDDVANELLALVRSRGGDQIAIKKDQQEVTFFGGNSEAHLDNSKVKVKVMAQTFRSLLNNTSNIIIVGHKNMDADCVSSTILLSNITKAYNIPTSIIYKTGGIEPIIDEIVNNNKQELTHHDFISEQQAINLLQPDTLVILVDHHNYEISNGQKIIDNADKIAVFDHHRRLPNLNYNPIYMYIEPGSSSTIELILEFIEYLSKDITIKEIEANIMYIGLLIDTNKFVNRTTSRTFEVASILRNLGADPNQCDLLLEEKYDVFIQIQELMQYINKYNNIIVVYANNNKIYNRTIIAMVANNILKIKEIEVCFIIANISSDDIAISARSKSTINVSTIMEKLNGGGHMTQAGVQLSNTKIEDAYKQFMEIIKEDLGVKDESNTIN